jgi:nucleoside-diphosphate-sugar epimerase
MVQADLLDRAALDAALADVTTVIHLAAALSGPALTELNVTAAQRLAEASRRAGVRRFIHCSSAGIYGDGTNAAPHRETDPPKPETDYEGSKLAGERVVVAALGDDVPCLVLRPTGIYGPGRASTRAFLDHVRRQRWWVHGPTRVIVHPCFVDDAADAIVRAAAADDVTGILNVGGERALPYPELIELVARMLGSKATQISAPALVGTTLRGLSRIAPAPRLMHLGRPLVNRAVDTDQCARRLGTVPVTLVEGWRRTVAAYRSTTS